MKLVVVGSEMRVGAIVGDAVLDLNLADPRIPSSLQAFIAGGGAAIERAVDALSRMAAAPEAAVKPLSETQLHAPWPGLRIAAMGGNYARHRAGLLADDPVVLERITQEIRDAGPWGFFKVSLPVGGPDDDVPHPTRSRYFDYEGEVAIVVGRTLKDFRGSRADDAIFGITLMNDWSIRDDANPSRPFNFNLPKNFDGSVTIGPAIVVGELNYDEVVVTTTVNGQLRQNYSSSEMVISFAECLEYLSRDFTLHPGDIVSGGTGAGTANDQTPRLPEGGVRPTDLFLKVGDVVEVASPGIGTLRNRVV